MQRTIRFPLTLWKTATTLALVALTAGTALGSPPLAYEDGEKKNEVSQAAIISEGQGGTEDGNRQIPDQVNREHWAYREIAGLGEKYGAKSRLAEEQSVTKDELVEKFIAALTGIAERYDKDGGQAISRDDLEALKD